MAFTDEDEFHFGVIVHGNGLSFKQAHMLFAGLYNAEWCTNRRPSEGSAVRLVPKVVRWICFSVIRNGTTNNHKNSHRAALQVKLMQTQPKRELGRMWPIETKKYILSLQVPPNGPTVFYSGTSL